MSIWQFFSVATLYMSTASWLRKSHSNLPLGCRNYRCVKYSSSLAHKQCFFDLWPIYKLKHDISYFLFHLTHLMWAFWRPSTLLTKVPAFVTLYLICTHNALCLRSLSQTIEKHSCSTLCFYLTNYTVSCFMEVAQGVPVVTIDQMPKMTDIPKN